MFVSAKRSTPRVSYDRLRLLSLPLLPSRSSTILLRPLFWGHVLRVRSSRAPRRSFSMPTRVYIARRIIPFEHSPRFHTLTFFTFSTFLSAASRLTRRRFSGTAQFIVLVGHAATTSFGLLGRRSSTSRKNERAEFPGTLRLHFVREITSGDASETFPSPRSGVCYFPLFNDSSL